MDYADHIAATGTAMAVIADALGAAPPETPVPTCPDWTMAELAGHVATISEFWAHLLADGRGDPRPQAPPAPARPDPEQLAGWVTAVGDQLLTELRTSGPAVPTWTWFDAGADAATVARRCAHEFTMHAVDAAIATGRVHSPDPDLAVDGIEEAFVLARARERSGTATGQTIHLHGTDREAEWLIRLGPDAIDVTREHAKGDLAVRAAVADLELLLYGRPPFGEVQQFGDEAVLDAWFREFTLG